MTCTKTQEFLEKNKVQVTDTVDAKKTPMGRAEAIALTKDVDEVYVAKGTKLVHVNLKSEKPGDDRIADLLLGPTGNLRAPTARVGKTLLVGFNPDAYSQVLSGARQLSARK